MTQSTGLTDDDIALTREQRSKCTRNIALAKRGAGSLVFTFDGKGLVSIKYRVYDTTAASNYRFKSLGFHVSCQADFISRYPDKRYLTVDQALETALGIYKSARQVLQPVSLTFNKMKSDERTIRKQTELATCSFYELLLGYKDSMQGRDSYGDIESAFRSHFLEKKNGLSKLTKDEWPDRNTFFKPEEYRWADLLNMDANKVFPKHTNDVQHRMINIKKLTTIVNRLTTHVSAAISWAQGYDNDVTRADFNTRDRCFNFDSNPFKGLKKYRQFERSGKTVLTYKQLWLIWHCARACMGKHGHFARLLIAMGGVRQEHLLSTPWAEAYLDHHLPHLRMASGKHGTQGEPYYYCSGLNRYAMDEMKLLKSLYGDRRYVFPSRKIAEDFEQDQPMRKDAFDKSFARLSKYVLNHYDYTMPPLTMGMLRGTLTSMMAEAGIPAGIRDLILLHNLSSNVRTRNYERFGYLSEKMKALKTWEDFLTGIINMPYDAVPDLSPEEEALSQSEKEALSQLY